MLKIVTDISNICRTIAIIPMMCLILITTIDVVSRYLLKLSVLDTPEISGMLLASIISLGFAFTTYTDDHIKFDMFMDRLSGRKKIVLQIVILLLSLGVFFLIAWQAIYRVFSSVRAGEFTGAMEIPLWPVKLVFAFGLVLTTLSIFVCLIAILHKLFDRQSNWVR